MRGRDRRRPVPLHCFGLLLFVHQDDVVAAVCVEELQAFGHPDVEPGRRVLGDFAHDVLTIAQPAQLLRPLRQPHDFTANLAGKPEAQQLERRDFLRRLGRAVRCRAARAAWCAWLRCHAAGLRH